MPPGSVRGKPASRPRLPKPLRILEVGARSRLRPEAQALLREYARSLEIDLDFQSFEEEVSTFPGAYAPPEGRFYLALAGGRAVGCVGVRKFDGRVAELKRLYLRPALRGTGIGRRLTVQAIRFARHRGYRAVRLDTLASMTVAQTLYASLGFRRIPAYRFNPVPNSSYWELRFAPSPRRAR